ncbi:MAG: hypothetical protein VX554_02480 [Candidatus Thermoplasmatota archaeon]|nr:hypothetical protein [Candidatus Thermoplasmatota archaeon]
MDQPFLHQLPVDAGGALVVLRLVVQLLILGLQLLQFGELLGQLGLPQLGLLLLGLDLRRGAAALAADLEQVGADAFSNYIRVS